jgi:hypothetical protein
VTTAHQDDGPGSDFSGGHVKTPEEPDYYQTCDQCGGLPTAFGTFKTSTVIVIGVSVGTQLGDFCRDCGIAIYRSAQKTSLVAGWWGLPFLATPIVMTQNKRQVEKFLRLPAPTYDDGPVPEVGAQYGRPLPMGKPVSQSPALIVPIVLGLLILVFCCGASAI